MDIDQFFYVNPKNLINSETFLKPNRSITAETRIRCKNVTNKNDYVLYIFVFEQSETEWASTSHKIQSCH